MPLFLTTINAITQDNDIIWPVTNENRLYTANTKEGWGKKGWDQFNELVKQEEKNRNDYEATVSGDEDENRIDRFHYDIVSSELDNKDNGEESQINPIDMQWGVQLVGVQRSK